MKRQILLGIERFFITTLMGSFCVVMTVVCYIQEDPTFGISAIGIVLAFVYYFSNIDLAEHNERWKKEMKRLGIQ